MSKGTYGLVRRVTGSVSCLESIQYTGDILTPHVIGLEYEVVVDKHVNVKPDNALRFVVRSSSGMSLDVLEYVSNGLYRKEGGTPRQLVAERGAHTSPYGFRLHRLAEADSGKGIGECSTCGGKLHAAARIGADAEEALMFVHVYK